MIGLITGILLSFGNVYLLGIKFYQQGRYDKAIKYLKMARYQSPDNEYIVRFIIDAYENMGDYKGAAEYADTLSRFHYCEGKALKGYFMSKLNVSEDELNSYFDQLKIKCARSPFPYYYQSLILFEKDTAKAFELLEWAYKKDSTNFAVNLTLAYFRYKLKQYRKAARYFRNILAHKYEVSAGILKIMGDAFYQAKDVSNAIMVYDSLVKLEPDNKIYWFRLGKLYLLKKNTGKAIRAFQRVLRLDPSDEGVRLQLALLYLDQKRYGDALREFNALVRTSKDPKILGYAYYWTAYIDYIFAYQHFKSREYKKAMELFKKCKTEYEKALTYPLPSDLKKEAQNQIVNAQKGWRKSYRKYNRIE